MDKLIEQACYGIIGAAILFILYCTGLFVQEHPYLAGYMILLGAGK